MKKLVFALAVAGCVTVATAQVRKPRPKLTPEQKQELIMMKVGGFIYQPIKTTVVRIYNNQTAVPQSEIEKAAENMRKGPNFPTEIVTTKWETEPVKEDGVGFAIVVYNDEKDPNKMQCAPDDGWAKVNVAPFLKDNPSAELASYRVQREIWRGLSFALGAGTTQNPMCPLKPAASVKELDELQGIVPTPEILDTIQKWAHHWGINKTRKVTYRKACQEGWAPAPTNDYQKVIWEEVRAKPTEPMKIKFDPKQGK